MSFLIHLHDLEHGAKTYQGEIQLESLDMDLIDTAITPVSALVYDVQAERCGSEILLQGSLSQAFLFECVRCLKSFPSTQQVSDWHCLAPLEGEENFLSEEEDIIDLTPVLREDMMLTLPQHPVCETGCDGLDTKLNNRQESADSDRDEGVEPSPWSELDRLGLDQD